MSGLFGHKSKPQTQEVVQPAAPAAAPAQKKAAGGYFGGGSSALADPNSQRGTFLGG